MFRDIVDQLEDRDLDMFPEMLLKLLPGNIMRHNIDPIEQMLPALFRENSPAHMIIMSMPPQEETKEMDLPGGGKMIMKKIRSARASFGRGGDSREILENKGEMALDDMFPTSNPLEAMLTLLYANAQRDKLPEGVIEGNIEPKVREVAGSKLVEDINNFIKGIEKGTKEFIDTEEGKKVIVTIEDYNKASDDVDKTTDMEVKEACLNILDNPLRESERLDLLKKANRVQTSLPKLASILEAFPQTFEMRSLINLVKFSIKNDGILTTSNKEAQKMLLEKLSDILKNKDSGAINELVFNTDLPDEEGEIITVADYPIDVEKLNNLTYDEASKALTKGIADIIFDDAKQNVDLDKFKTFIEDLIKNQDTEAEKEEVTDRIVDPILSTFEKDAFLMAFSPDEDICKRASLLDFLI